MRVCCVAVHKNPANKSIVGYRLMDYDSGRMVDLAPNQVEHMIKNNRVPVGNMGLLNGKVHMDNGSPDRYPVVINGALVENQTAVTVVGEVSHGGVHVGYVLCRASGEEAVVNIGVAVKTCEAYGVTNGKVVSKNGNRFISSIKGSYESIEFKNLKVKPYTVMGLVIKSKEPSPQNISDTVSKAPQATRPSPTESKAQPIQKTESASRPSDPQPAKRPTQEGKPQASNEPRTTVQSSLDAAKRRRRAIPQRENVVREQLESDEIRNQIDEQSGMTAEQKMVKCYNIMRKFWPLYYYILTSLKKVETRQVNAIAVSVDTLFFNPNFIRERPVSQILFALKHEALHIVQKHPLRARLYNAKRKNYNIAADLFINKTICEEHNMNKKVTSCRVSDNVNIDAVSGMLYSDKVNTKTDTAESIYREIEEEQKKREEEQKKREEEQRQQAQQSQKEQQNQSPQQDGNGEADPNSQEQDPNQDPSSPNQGEQNQDQGNPSQNQDEQQEGQQQGGQDQSQGQDQGGQDKEDQEQGDQGSQGNQAQEGQEQGDQDGNSQGAKSKRGQGGQQGEENEEQNSGDGTLKDHDYGSDVEDYQGQIDQDQGDQGIGDEYGDSEEGDEEEGLQGRPKGSSRGSNKDDSELGQNEEQDQNYTEDGEYTEGDEDEQDANSSDTQGNKEENGSSPDRNGGPDKLDDSLWDEEDDMIDSFRGDSLGEADSEEDLVESESTAGMSNQALEERSKNIIERALTSFKKSGQAVGSHSESVVARMMEEAIAPDVMWESIVNSRLNKISKTINTYSRPDRRFLSRGMILPGPKKIDPDGLERVKVCADTSGSISDKDLGIMFYRIKRLLVRYKVEAELLYWDTEIRARYQFKDIKELMRCKPAGGGGTDVNCIFDEFRKPIYRSGKRPKPSLIIVVTDGYLSPIREENKSFKDTVWIVSGNASFEPGFGVIAKYKEKEQK